MKALSPDLKQILFLGAACGVNVGAGYVMAHTTPMLSWKVIFWAVALFNLFRIYRADRPYWTK